MDENKSITYDDLIQTRNTQILKSIVPFLDAPTQKPLAMLIQLMEWKNATAAFSRQENSMAACSLPAGTKRRDAMLSAVRKYCTPKEQEMIDTIQTLFCIMENQDLFHNPLIRRWFLIGFQSFEQSGVCQFKPGKIAVSALFCTERKTFKHERCHAVSSLKYEAGKGKPY